MNILETMIFMFDKYLLGIIVLIISIFAYYFFKKINDVLYKR